MKHIKSICLVAILAIFSLAADAQAKPEMADVMRSNGKIYIVVAVCLTILIGLFLYVVSIDRKISRIEKERI
jgi:hypothetical protein